MTPTLRKAGIVLAIGVLVLSWTGSGAAHRTVISNFTFHQDVRPILAAKCGTCHGDGGVAGLPLLRFDEARAAAWPIRQALLTDRMPPWSAVAGDTPLKGSPALTAREMNTLMTWAAGGTPAGTAQVVPETAADRWPLGAPDTVLPIAPAALEAGEPMADREVVLPAASLRGKWIALVDVRPQDPAMVRRAEVALRRAGLDRVIASWLPGETPQRLEAGAAFRVPASASLVVRLHYQRPIAAGGAAVASGGELGIYLSRAPARRDVRAIDLTHPGPFDGGLAFTREFAAGTTLVALRQVSGPADATAVLTIIAPDGSRSTLVQMTIRPEWPRRYVFARPVRLAPGSRIETRVTAAQTSLWASLLGGSVSPQNSAAAVSFAIETVD